MAQQCLPFDQIVNYTCSTEATYIGREPDGLGGYNYVIKTAQPNEPRFPYDPETGEKLGLLNEASGENLLLWSQKFDESVWSTDDASITTAPSISSPIEGGNVYKLVEGTLSGEHNLQQNVSSGYSTGDDVSCYYFCKAAERTAVNIFLAGTDISSSFSVIIDLTSEDDTNFSEYLGGGWHKIYATAPISSTGGFIRARLRPFVNGSIDYQGDGSSGIYVAASQIEKGYPTSYIPTTNSPAVRSKSISKTNAINLSNVEFSFYLDCILPPTDASGSYLLGFNSSTNDRTILLYVDGTNFKYEARRIDGSIQTQVQGSTSLNSGDRAKILVSVKNGSQSIHVNGIKIASGTATGIDVLNELIRIGTGWIDSNTVANYTASDFSFNNYFIEDKDAAALTTLEPEA